MTTYSSDPNIDMKSWAWENASVTPGRRGGRVVVVVVRQVQIDRF